MRIQVVCHRHPGALVFILEGTTSFETYSGTQVEEKTERANFIRVDEGNLYCSDREEEHHFGAMVVQD